MPVVRLGLLRRSRLGSDPHEPSPCPPISRHLCTLRAVSPRRRERRLWTENSRFVSPIGGCSMVYQDESLAVIHGTC